MDLTFQAPIAKFRESNGRVTVATVPEVDADIIFNSGSRGLWTPDQARGRITSVTYDQLYEPYHPRGRVKQTIEITWNQ